eukprot:CAMPEP_0119033600 /NCGR_PEP_ID=MMETSP1177-20130426/653_1 /TAXON_ID=2985 /ORGANISM="Ochromonas sp, Strain CCMP1899" /LENGTH=160 /DNA_ID=CAMNT_0006990469 /DNA_START=137 /DNA_END=616 /DNA_ORIENTATION=+
MPSIMSAKTGTIDKWLKKEGEIFDGKEALCEVTIEDIRIAIDAHRPGVLAEILIEQGETVDVGVPIAMFVDNIQEYMEHVENIRIASGEADMMKEMKPQSDDDKKDILKLLLNEIRYLITNDDIKNDTEFSKEIQSLGRKGNSELVSIFEASYDGNFNRE